MNYITSIILNLRTEIVEDFSYTHTYWIFLLPLSFIAGDVISGLLQAFINGTCDSTKMRRGLFRKACEMLVIILVWVAGLAIPQLEPLHPATWISGYVVLMEALSILENLDQAGVPFPRWLLKRLKKTAEAWTEGDEEEAKQ